MTGFPVFEAGRRYSRQGCVYLIQGLLETVVNRIKGAALKPAAVANPTTVISAEIEERDVAAAAALRNSLAAMRLDAVVYITESSSQPSGIWLPKIFTTPREMDAAVGRLMAIRDFPAGAIRGLATRIQPTVP
jgi:hypothetical protein